MDLEQHLNHLEAHRDWQGVVEALEQGIASAQDPSVKAAYHLRLGRVLHGKFLQGVKALKHFQDAYKLSPALGEALADARAIYWELGKLNMVQKLIELQIKASQDPLTLVSLELELGNVLCDQAQYERALESYARAVELGERAEIDGAGLASVLEDARTEADQWQERVAALLRVAHEAETTQDRCAFFLRAARIARRFAPEEFESIALQAYAADPSSLEAAAVFENLLVEAQRTDDILVAQRSVLEQLAGTELEGEAAFRFGVRWALRHQNLDVAAELLERALRVDPSREAVLAFLRDTWGTRKGEWARVVSLADEVARTAAPEDAIHLLACAGQLTWREQGDLLGARSFLERLVGVDAEHPLVKSYEAQTGRQLTAAPLGGSVPPRGSVFPARSQAPGAPSAPPPASIPEASGDEAPVEELEAAEDLGVQDLTDEASEAAAAYDDAAEELAAEELGAEEALASSEAGVDAAGVDAAGMDAAGEEPAAAELAAEELEATEVAPEPVAPESAPLPTVNHALIAELREKLRAQEDAKRFHEYVKTLIALGDEVPDVEEKVALYGKAADLYVNKFANQAEAVKVYEKIAEVDPSNASALAYLRQMYEKRRDWEKLIALATREAALLPEGGERTAKYKEIALLATERVKKPEVCIDLWAVVVENDPSDPEALVALSQLYERARDYPKLADVLEKLVDVTYDEKEKISLLNKLGQVVGDRLNDDARAVDAYRILLTLQPDDRRAQEQLKKRYVTLGRWDDLEVFYAESGKWDEFIRVLETNESKAESDEQRIGMLMKIAELWMTQKGKPDRASKAYEKVLSIDANHRDAAERLIPIYAQANNPKGLAGAIEVKLNHVEDPSDRLELLREVAGLYETRINEKSKAFERFLAAFGIAAADERSQADVERAAKLTGRWDDLVAAYRAAIQSADGDGDTSGANALRLRLGRVLVDEVGRIDDALAEYRAVYDAEPENAVALGALEALYRQTEKWTELLEVYGKKRELAYDADERKPILYEIARLYEVQLADPEHAIETYIAVLEDDEVDAVALEALDRLYRQTGRWSEYADVLRRRVVLDLDEAALVDLKFRLAEAQNHHLDEPAGALENYREILFLDAAHEGARLALEGMLEQEELRAEAASILEGIYEGREDWERLLGAIEILAAASGETERRVSLLRKAATTAASQLGDLPRALDAQARALREDPAFPDSRAELEDLAAQAGAWDALIEIYSGIAAGLDEPALAREYWVRLAAIQEQLGKIDDAAQSYDRVLALDASDAEALLAMDALYRKNARWQQLIGVYRRRIELADEGTNREELYAQMAQVFEERLGRPDDAIAAYREVLALDPASGVALSALDGLFTRQESWHELAENLETQLTLAETEESQIALMLRLAALRESRMDEVELAIEGYRQVLEREPTNGAALGALQRLGELPAYELAIAEILEPLYRQSGDYQRLIGVHEVQVRRADDSARKVELLHQIAELYEDAAGDVNAAFDTYSRALAVDPSHEATLEALDRLARATGRFVDMAQVIEELAGLQEDTELASGLFTRAARVFEGDVGDVERAIELYRKVLVIDGTNLAAAESLQGLFQAKERYADMSAILQRKAEMLEDVDQKKGALYQAAQLEEDVLERRESAIGVYLKVLEIDNEDLRSIDALITLYLGLQRWQELLGIYSKKADLVYDVEEKKLILYQVGAVYERELHDVENAIDTYQKVLELDPDDLAALGRLDVLYQTAENWQDLLSVLTHEAELTEDPAEAVSFQYRIAELYEKHLGDLERSVELYRDILNVAPDHAPTLAALEGIKSGAAAPLSAAAVLEPVYDAMGEWQRLISVLEVMVRFADDAFQRVELLHRIARLYEESLQDHASAFDTYARAVQVDSSNEESLGSLERLATFIERWPAVARLYDGELEKLEGEPERLVELGLRVAQVYEVQLEDVDSAVARYRRVLEADVTNQSAIRALDRLFTQTERWADLVEILARESDIAESPEEILELKYRLGQVQQHRLNDVSQAIAAYREVIAAAPEHTPSLEALEGLFAAGVRQLEIGEVLEPLYQSMGEWEKLIKVREAELTHTTDEDERIGLFHKIAEDAEERLMDATLAFQVHVRALRERPLDERSGEEIERLASGIDGGWEDLANAYADILGIEGLATSTQATIGKRLARVFEEELADVQKAEQTYNYVLTVVPQEPDALANLDRIYSSLEQWAELAGILEQRASVAEEDSDKVELNTRLGEVYEERLGQVDDAIRAYRRIFDRLEPANEAAILALGRIYEAKGEWVALQGVYSRELENAVGDVQEAEIRAKMARVSSDRLGNVEEAIEGWKRVLDLRGEDPEALFALSELYQRQGRWAELTDVLERHFDIADTDEERVSVLSRRAQLFLEQLHRDDEALETWQRVLDIDYANVPALRAVAGIWRSRNDAQELVAALHMTIDRAQAAIEPSEAVEVYRELGRLYGDLLEQPYEAGDAWRNLLEVDPKDFEAMDRLEKMYRAEENHADVVKIKMQRAEALTDPAEQVRELLEVTVIWRDLAQDYQQATPAFQRVLSIDPAHDLAFEELEKLHTEGRRWDELVELYLNRLETREAVAERSDLFRRIARVFEEQQGDTNQAFDALTNAFSEDYGDDATAEYLERMAQATGRWAELINTANAWLQEQTEPRPRIQLCLRLGKWYGENLDRSEYAFPYYEMVLSLDPNNVQVRRRVAAMHRLGGNWQAVGEELTRALNVAIANEDRKVILHELGELLEKNMGQLDQGLAFYRRALEVDPIYLPTLESLERIYEAQGRHSDLVDVLGSKVRALTDAEAIATHKLRMAALYEGQLGNLELAGRTYREVLEIDSGSLTALRGLERVYGAVRNWTELVLVLEQQLDVVDTERDRVEVLLKLASIQEEQFLKPDLAARRLEQALEIDPTEMRAYEALERCYRRLKQWLDLVQTYERHISETIDVSEKIRLYFQIAQVQGDEIGDVPNAIDAYRNIVDLDDSNIVALDALSKLYEKQDDAAQAIEAMGRVADLTTDGSQRVEMYYRIGKALEEKLSDRIQARERFEMAIDLDPSHLPSLAALRAIAVDEADWDLAARYLEQEQLGTQAPRARAKLLVELGRLRDEMLGEHDLAVQAYELAMQCDDDSEEAALPLAEEYVRSERWAEAEPLVDLLVRKSKNRERHEQHALYKMQGKVLAALSKFEKALKAYQTAHQLDLTDQETIRGVADVAFELQDWPSALSNYQKVLTALGEDDLEQRVDVYYRLGAIKREQQQVKQAINNWEKALGLNGEHRPTLEALVDIYARGNDWKQVAAYKRQILDSVFDGDERYTLLLEIGEVWADKENAVNKAIEAYEEAFELKPQDHVLLHKLLQLYQKAEDWQKMVDTLQAIADLEERPEIKSRYFYTMAQLYRDKLEDPDRAVELFNDALDLNPGYLEAFERINKVLTSQKNWKQLERSYRKMIHRIAGKGNTDLENTLWHQLGIIYRDRLGLTDEAIEAFKMAATIKPDLAIEHQILAELYETAERWDDAIREQRQILVTDPLSIDPYRALYRLYLHKQSYDEAWCLAAAMCFLKKADEEESRFFEDYRPQGMLPVRGRVTNELWARCLFHQNENMYVSKIMEMIAPAALQAKIAQLRSQNKLPGLDPRFKQDPQTSTVTFAKTFGWAAQVLGIQAPDLYVRSDVPGSIVAVHAMPPASIAGQTVLTGFSPQELTFICGKHLASYRGEHYIRNLFSTQAELTIMLFAGMMIANSSLPVPQELQQNVTITARELAKYMQPVQIEGLRIVVKRFVDEGAKANIKLWNQAVELTASRCGLLVSGDLEIAKKILSSEAQLPGDLTPAEKMKELLVFSVSEEYSNLRKALGVAVGQEG
jgi:tetratricopeptide (TPR) repeat protein